MVTVIFDYFPKNSYSEIRRTDMSPTRKRYVIERYILSVNVTKYSKFCIVLHLKLSWNNRTDKKKKIDITKKWKQYLALLCLNCCPLWKILYPRCG